ncbi:MAG: RimK-like ATPgrasp N-terminal domain-containing protein [candidate division Zixibacteria bacterium]|nr:RimK-like ATPgrasp N-terminal domain-containing protein [candidate division Zixibacteria bacterium]
MALARLKKPLLPDRGVTHDYMAYFSREDCYVNLRGDYYYLGPGYYASQDWEYDKKRVHPTCKESLDGYIVPLFLEKIKLVGLPIPDYYITNGYFEPPVIVDSLNPFMTRQSIVTKQGQQTRVAKSMSRNYTYAISCQELPPGARVGYFRCILGECLTPRYRHLAGAVWRVFRLPLALVRVIVLKDGTILLSALQPLTYGKLNKREKEIIDRLVSWRI